MQNDVRKGPAMWSHMLGTMRSGIMRPLHANSGVAVPVRTNNYGDAVPRGRERGRVLGVRADLPDSNELWAARVWETVLFWREEGI